MAHTTLNSADIVQGKIPAKASANQTLTGAQGVARATIYSRGFAFIGGQQLPNSFSVQDLTTSVRFGDGERV